jgi:hypothetical protein
VGKSPTYPPDSQLRILATQLAKHVKVPADNKQEFCQRVYETVVSVRNRDRRGTGEKPGLALLDAADAARRLQKAFSRLKKPDRDHVEKIKQSQMQLADAEIKDLATAITNISMLLNTAVGRQAPIPRYLDRVSRGPEVKDQMLRELIFRLLAAARDTDGRLTFDQNPVAGSLAYALNKLRPYVPPGLIPDPLPRRRIQRLKTEFGRLSL